MWTTFGIFFLILGFVLLLAGLVRGLFARSASTAGIKFASIIGGSGAILIMLSLFMLHQGEGKGLGRVPIGVVAMLIGLAVTAVGIWYAFWSPIAFRNLAFGWKLLLVGLLVMVCGIVMMTVNFRFDAHGEHSREVWDGVAGPDWGEIFNHHMGPIPFGVFVVAALIVTIALALRNALKPGAILGAALFVVALLMLLYFMGPGLFPNTW